MNATIAIIEDNPDNLELMRYLLTQFGYKVISATDGLTGLSLIKNNSPDLIICDINLPQLNGYEMARAIKAEPNLSNIPLIAVTAYAMVGDRDKILDAGYDGYISKPIDPEVFVKQLGKFISQKI